MISINNIVDLCILFGIVITGINSQCPGTRWQCKNQECIKGSELCDGRKDCTDGSDETPEACIHFICPPYAFRCAYGGCVSKTAECNREKDCADNSDEITQNCLPTYFRQHRDICGSGQFQCTSSDQCIPMDNLCDGKQHCRDGTDEVVENCAANFCPVYAFRCGYGACIPGPEKCDGERNCADGSDETNLLCRTIPETPGDNINSGKCLVGNWPDTIVSYQGDPTDIVHSGEFADNYADLHISCQTGFTRYGDQEIRCFKGKWDKQQIPVCERRCKPIENRISVDAKCTYKSETVACTDSQRPDTKVVYSCKVGYSKVEPSIPQDTSRCSNGEWDYPPITCVPICGAEPYDTKTFASGSIINNTYVPWSVAIYTKRQERDRTIGQYRMICGGTIVSTNIVISAAHCFWNGASNTKEDKRDYLVVAGKYYRNIDAEETQPIQRFKLKELIIFEEYIHIHGNYEADIAVLVLKGDITYQNHIKPICIDDSDRSIEVGAVGRTSGFGVIDTEFTPSTELRVAELVVHNRSECIVKKGPVYEDTITSDKLCIKGQIADAVCQGDSGGGFTVARYKNNVRKYYLYGVVSHAAGGTPLCNENSYVAFTNIQFYITKIKNLMFEFRSGTK